MLKDRPGNVFGTLGLFKYLVLELHVYVTLQYYLVVTSKLRTSSKLVIPYIEPYNAVTSNTIGRWIKALLQQVGINTQTFSAHSTRSASVSKAVVYFLLLQTLFLRLLVGLVNQPFVSIIKSL